MADSSDMQQLIQVLTTRMDRQEHFLNYVHGVIRLKTMATCKSVDGLLVVVFEKGPSVSIVPIGQPSD